MVLPFFLERRMGAYLLKQKLMGRKRYPLVLMLEPLFRCNLACAGCGKIDYPDPILNRRMTRAGMPGRGRGMRRAHGSIPGGEPLIHKEIGEIVKGLVAQKRFVSLCTNALLLEKKLHLFEPSPYLFFSVHLDGLKEHHDKAVCQEAPSTGRSRPFWPPRPRASPSTSTQPCSTAIRPRTSPGSWTSPATWARRLDLSRLCL